MRPFLFHLGILVFIVFTWKYLHGRRA